MRDPTAIGAISVEAFRALYSGSGEFAVIDPREELLFSRAHLYAATNMPLSHLELLIGPGVPLKDTMIVLCDDGDGISERAARVLSDLDYNNIHILTGGLPVWALSGGAVFAGVNVPSKAFGEAVEHHLGTPRMSIETLREKTAAGENIVLLDARPLDEHTDHCIPGSISCPSAELIYRTAELNIAEDAQVVVHCAGRTRSIIGAQTLIDGGLAPNAVSLENGTPAWRFAGLDPETGSKRTLPGPGTKARAAALQIAERLCADWQIPVLATEDIGDWQNAPGTRYTFDIRSEAEYLAGHLPGAQHIAGGQLIQTTEVHMVVQNAYVLLIDADGVRAPTTAMWLRRMGWKNIAVCQMDQAMAHLDSGRPPAPSFDDLALISIDEIAAQLHAGTATLCDIRSSVDYRRGHIEGACYLSRANIDEDAAKLPTGKNLILMSDDRPYAELISRDLKRLGHTVHQLDADMSAWTAASHPIETGPEWLISRPIDTYLEAGHFDDPVTAERENRAYLSWEIALIDHIKGDPAVRYDMR